MKTYTQIKKEIVEEKEKYLKNYIFWCKKIKKKAKYVLKDDNIKVLIFGSIIKGCWGPNSDIDVLVVSEKIKGDFEDIICIKTEIKNLLVFSRHSKFI